MTQPDIKFLQRTLYATPEIKPGHISFTCTKLVILCISISNKGKPSISLQATKYWKPGEQGGLEELEGYFIDIPLVTLVSPQGKEECRPASD